MPASFWEPRLPLLDRTGRRDEDPAEARPYDLQVLIPAAGSTAMITNPDRLINNQGLWPATMTSHSCPSSPAQWKGSEDASCRAAKGGNPLRGCWRSSLRLSRPP